jgi:hypothetical protein
MYASVIKLYNECEKLSVLRAFHSHPNVTASFLFEHDKLVGLILKILSRLDHVRSISPFPSPRDKSMRSYRVSQKSFDDFKSCTIYITKLA